MKPIILSAVFFGRKKLVYSPLSIFGQTVVSLLSENTCLLVYLLVDLLCIQLVIYLARQLGFLLVS